MRFLVTAFMLLIMTLSSAQTRPLQKRIIVKTNLFSLIAQKPTVSIEKAITQKVSAELSFVQGRFNNFFLTDHYTYNGYLLRVKKYVSDLYLNSVNVYGGLYLGILRRVIQSEGWTTANGYVGYPSRNFSANSIRGGGSLGFCYFTKTKIIFDTQLSTGYGRYLHLDYSNPNTRSKGYPDLQIWFSIGYCF